MALKDLTAHLIPDLQIPYAGKTYTIAPPTKDAGIKLAAINAVGVQSYVATLEDCPTCGRTGTPELPQETRDLLASIGHLELGQLSLGHAVYEEMLADGVPGPHVDKFALYALYYWVMGENTADAIFEAERGGGASGEAQPGMARTSTRKGGRRTGSGSRTN